MSELEQTDANEEQLSSEVANDGDSVEAQAEESQSDDNKPFHEHPRWKEMVEQRDQSRETAQQAIEQNERLQARLEAIESELSQPQGDDPNKDVFERVKSADKEFGKLFEDMAKKTQNIDQLRNEIRSELQQELSASKLETQIAREFELLHDKFDVPEFWRSKYENELQLAASKNPTKFKDFNAMRKEYENIHSSYQAQLEGIKRDTTKSYVKDKKSATSRPSTQPKGVPAGKGADKPQYKNAEEMRYDIVQAALKAPRGGQNNL